MKVLVTGATGFLGQYLVAELQAAGHDVRAFGRNRQVGQELAERGATFIAGDFRHYPDIEKACRKVDGVIHAGALSTVWGAWEDFYQANVVGTENVLKACQANHVQRLVYVSSPSIYAAPRDQLAIKECDAPAENKLNYYIQSKILSEQKVAAYPQVPTVILRPRGLFGIGDTSVLPRVLKLSQTIGIPLVKGGQQVMDMTCVENVALACRLALEKPGVDGQVYNITNGEPRIYRELIEEMLEALHLPKKYRPFNAGLLGLLANSIEGFYRTFRIKKEPPLTRYTYYLMRYSQTLDIAKARAELGYEPKMTIREGIEKYAKYAQTH